MGSFIPESKDGFANEVDPPSLPEIISIEGTGHDVDNERTFYFLSNAGSSLHIPESATFPQLRFNPGKRSKNMIMCLVIHAISPLKNSVDFISQTWSKNLSFGSNVFALDIPLIICIRIEYLSMTDFSLLFSGTWGSRTKAVDVFWEWELYCHRSHRYWAVSNQSNRHPSCRLAGHHTFSYHLEGKFTKLSSLVLLCVHKNS